MAVLYTSSAHPNGSQGLIWGEADYTQTNNNTYSRITLTWLGECWQGVSQYEGTTYTSNPASISVSINGTTFSGSITGYRSHSVSSSKYEWSASNATLGYVDVTRGHTSKTVTISLTYTIESTKYTGSTTVTVPALTSYTVSYNANGGSGAPSSQTKYYGESLTLSSTKPTRTGYTFSKWNTKSDGSGTNYSSGGSYTANAKATLYAQWAPKTYTVSYNANGGSGAPSSQTKTYGVDLTLSSTKPTRSGYTFIGWGTSNTSTLAKYQAGGSYTSNAAITLYAIWKKTITISYSLDGGSGGPSSESKTIYNSATSASFTIPSTKPTKTNYNFTGWKVGSTATIVQPGGTVSLSTSTALTAQWALAYIPPKFGTITAHRTDSTGEANDGTGIFGYLKFTWAKGSNGGTVLSTTASAKYREHGASSWTTITNGSSTANTFEAVFGGSLSSDKQYDITLSLEDTGQPAVTYTTYISTEAFTIDVNAEGTAVAFFKAAPENGSGLYANGNMRLEAGNGVDRFVIARQDDSSVISYGVDTTGVHGLYSDKGSRWMVKAPADGSSVTINDGTSSHTYIAGDLTVQGHNSPIGSIIEVENDTTTSIPSGTSTPLMSITLPDGVWVVRVLIRFPAMGSDRTKYVYANISGTSGAAAYMYRAPCENMITEVMMTQIITAGGTYYVNVYQNSGSAKTFATGSAASQNIRAVRIA